MMKWLKWLFRPSAPVVETIVMGEDDLAVIMFPGRVTHAEIERLREQWHFYADGRKLIVLQDGARISVLKKGKQFGRGDGSTVFGPGAAHP